jgi:hypothetical protein
MSGTSGRNHTATVTRWAKRITFATGTLGKHPLRSVREFPLLAVVAPAPDLVQSLAEAQAARANPGGGTFRADDHARIVGARGADPATARCLQQEGRTRCGSTVDLQARTDSVICNWGIARQ